ncbi:MAG: DNA polymerase III subunit gamma/tau [Bacteroides sp.]|nr:DNA polymerase III subunit gamma/tau [Bacteroides sp.]
MSDQYIVSARKYRPATFDTVVGQQNLTTTLKNSIRTGRLAHAYLFCGPRGVGKTSCARIFARTINCLSPTPDGEACGTCDSCRAIDKGNSFNLMELDAASNNSVDDIRAVTEQVAIPPQVGKYRVFIIDEVHMLSSAAFNAFLKTLEEPPAYAIFILATTEKHKVLPTILSRCQIYDFHRITIPDMVAHLQNVAEKENIQADPRALGLIARKADGAMRDALSIFDQIAASCAGNITYDAVVENLNVLDYEFFFNLVDTFARGDSGGALLLYKEIRDRGFDSLFFVNSLAQHVRDLMVAADPRTIPLLETSQDVAERLVAQARALPLKWYYEAMKLLNDCDLNYRSATGKQLLVELTLIRLCQLAGAPERPFENSDRPALRNPSEPPRAKNTTTPAETTTPAPSAEISASPSPEISASPTPIIPNTPKSPNTPKAAPAGAPPVAPPRRPASFNINRRAETASTSLERRDQDFSDEAFLKAWHEYITLVPDQQILISAMRTAVPKRTSRIDFNVIVDHPAQQQAFELAMPKLLAHLRERLNNDYLTIQAIINPDKEIVKPLTPREFLEKTIRVNATLGKFLKDLDIEVV